MRPTTAGLRRVSAVAMLWLALLASGTAQGEIHISSAGGDPETEALAQTVRNELSAASPRVAAVDARVTIGAAAFREALAQDDKRPLIAAYLTSVEFRAVLGTRERPPHVTAVFSNPDPVAQLVLARELLGQATLGVFDSPAAHSLASRITELGVRALPVADDAKIDSLLRSTQSIDAIIVLPDPTILTRSNISHVVRTLYQQRKVLIGHSATLTRVGALASVYASREAITRTVARVIEQYADSATLSDPLFVSEVDVAINDRLARSLNIVLPDRGAVLKAVRSKAAEATP